jgi:hypothetical protein
MGGIRPQFSPHDHKRQSTGVMSSSTVVIARRFRGPLNSANGGYAAGVVASAIDGSAEVTLRLPPPLEMPLELSLDGGRALLLHGDALVAEARPADPALEAPDPPTWAEALAAAEGAGNFDSPEFAECFVCGTRPAHDGLAIHAGPVPGRDGLVAAPWVAHDVTPEVVWASIDCPGAYAVVRSGRGEPVLGRITARITRLPAEGERCVVIGWPLGEDGRKLFAGTALFGETGDLVAIARQIWIRPAV